VVLPTKHDKNLLTIEKETTDDLILNLVSNAQQQERGFRLLLEKYQERLYWQIRRIVIQHEDTNDVLQNCLVKIYRGLPKFQGNSKLYTWMYRIASNEAITFLKKQKRFVAASLDSEENYLENQLKADEYFDGDAAQLKLQKAIQQLPEKQKEVFRMRYFDEMPYQEISDVLGTSVGGLKASFHHATKKIEQYLLM